MTTTRKEFVKFYSPGTITSEETTRPIDIRDTHIAIKMAKDIKERHGATPYAFRFETKIVSDPIDDGEGGKLFVDPKLIDYSGDIFIGGEILKFDDISRNEDTSTLLDNMKCNNWPIVIENRRSYRITLPFEDNDMIINDHGMVIKRGNEKDLRDYRIKKNTEWECDRNV